MGDVLTLPPWSSTSGTSSFKGTLPMNLDASATSVEKSQKTKFGLANDKEWCRYIYGRVSIAPVVPTIAKHPSGDLLLLCVFAANPCQTIEKIIVADEEYTGQKAVYTGGQATADTWLKEAIADYDDVLSGYTYVVLRIKNQKDVKFSNIRAIIQGQPIAEGYNNPAHCMAHFARTYMALTVEPTGLAETAARCDELVVGGKRRTLSLSIEKRASKANWLATLSEYAGCYYYIKNG